MNSYEVVGYAQDGAIYCVGCFNRDPESDDVSPIFADAEFDYYPVCEHCGGVIDEVCSLSHCHMERVRDIIESMDIEVDSYNETSITIEGVEYSVEYAGGDGEQSAALKITGQVKLREDAGQKAPSKEA